MPRRRTYKRAIKKAPESDVLNEEAQDVENVPDVAKFKGIEEECLHRALTLTLRPPRLDLKYKAKIEVGSTNKDSSLDGNNYQRLIASLDSVFAIVQNCAKKGSVVFELGQQGNLHYHVYLKLKSDVKYIYLYREFLFAWQTNFGHIKDNPSRTANGRRIWKDYLLKEWTGTQNFFFGETRFSDKPIKMSSFSKLIYWLDKNNEKLQKRYAKQTSMKFVIQDKKYKSMQKKEVRDFSREQADIVVESDVDEDDVPEASDSEQEDIPKRKKSKGYYDLALEDEKLMAQI